MSNYDDHQHVLSLLEKDQEADHDNRERAREARLFLNKRDGQWEPKWWEASAGKPRYTFDLCNPIVDQICGEMEQNEFEIKITPESGDATKESAKLLDGLIRNIEANSKAAAVFNRAGRLMVKSGIDGWHVAQKYVDHNSFDQDLVIESIPNFLDRAWLDSTASEQDGSDARHGFLMQAMSPAEYKRRWPKGKAQSVSSDNSGHAYFHKPEVIIVGKLYFIREEERELVLMDNGKVYEAGEEFQSVADDLLALGVGEVKRRKRKVNVVHSRLFDVGGWLGEAQKTVFSHIPIVPTYANFEVYENKIIYWGCVEKLMDEQRVLNYSLSRQVEEGVMAPRSKYWMTPEQAKGHERKLATLNTNADPVQLFNPDPQNPGIPQQNGGAQINPGLSAISETMVNLVGKTAGLFAANMGDNPGLQSGVAIEKLQHKGDNGTVKYFKAQEVAIAHTGRILVDAIPKVYNAKRQARILKEDGSFDMVTLHDTVIDHQTGQEVVLNDLSAGRYDVACIAGPAFQSRQAETVAALTEVAQVAPTIMQMGDDILAKNINAPGMDLLASRLRQVKFQQGLIPVDEMTDEEKQQAMQAAQQPPQPDPNMVLAQAEMTKAQAMVHKEQNSAEREAVKLQMEQFKFMQEQQASQAEQMKQILEFQKMTAETMKIIREAVGATAVASPAAELAFQQQAQKLTQQ